MKNPWTTLSTKDIYENPWIKIQEHRVINPGGQESIYGKAQNHTEKHTETHAEVHTQRNTHRK